MGCIASSEVDTNRVARPAHGPSNMNQQSSQQATRDPRNELQRHVNQQSSQQMTRDPRRELERQLDAATRAGCRPQQILAFRKSREGLDFAQLCASELGFDGWALDRAAPIIMHKKMMLQRLKDHDNLQCPWDFLGPMLRYRMSPEVFADSMTANHRNMGARAERLPIHVAEAVWAQVVNTQYCDAVDGDLFSALMAMTSDPHEMASLILSAGRRPRREVPQQHGEEALKYFSEEDEGGGIDTSCTISSINHPECQKAKIRGVTKEAGGVWTSLSEYILWNIRSHDSTPGADRGIRIYKIHSNIHEYTYTTKGGDSGGARYTYTVKCMHSVILCTQTANIDGKTAERAFFMFDAYEYGEGCCVTLPKKHRLVGRVYIAYLDSVQWYEKDSDTTTHCFQNAGFKGKSINKIILQSYLEYMGALGFRTGHIWACPLAMNNSGYWFRCGTKVREGQAHSTGGEKAFDILDDFYKDMLKGCRNVNGKNGSQGLKYQYYRKAVGETRKAEALEHIVFPGDIKTDDGEGSIASIFVVDLTCSTWYDTKHDRGQYYENFELIGKEIVEVENKTGTFRHEWCKKFFRKELRDHNDVATSTKEMVSYAHSQTTADKPIRMACGQITGPGWTTLPLVDEVSFTDGAALTYRTKVLTEA